MTPIQTNKHVFFDEAGNVLESGSIYIGQPNTDPRTNPKTVTFTDAGGVSFTASQPLVTVAGRISYNGKPMLAQVDGEYSMLVFDSAGKQTDYYPSISDEGGGAIADFSEVTRVGLTLNDIKSFDSSVGDTIENVGEIVFSDKKGAKWIVVSASGSPGDDDNVIDLVNGLQAKRIKSYYPRVIWTGSATSVNMTDFDVADRGSGRYLVYVGSTYALLFVSDNDDFARGLLDTELSTDVLAIQVVRYSAFSDNFTAVRQAIGDITTSPVTLETDLNITKIEKF